MLFLWCLLLFASDAFAETGDLFLSSAKKYVDDKPAIIDMYTRHMASHKAGEDSELDLILGDMNDYVIENEKVGKRKHILTILADDMGWADIGFNDETFVTPTLDFLGKWGMKLTNMYVQPTCSPSRAALLTGRDVTNTGLQDGAIIPGESRFLPYDLRTAGNYFKDANYSTVFIGKWHLGQRYENQSAAARGYDYFFGILGGTIDSYTKRIGLLCGSDSNNHTAVFGDDCQFLNGYDFQENGVPFIDHTSYASDILTNKAINQINLHDKNTDLLLHYHTNVPHAPLVVPQELFDVCAGVSAGAEDVIQPYFRQIICGMVSSLDIDTIRLVFALGLNGMLHNTLIEFHSDNGGMTIAGSSNGPYKSQKGSCFDGGIRSPFLMFGPGLHTTTNPRLETFPYVRDDLFTLSDILPTLLGYANVDVDQDNFDGHDTWNRLVMNEPLARDYIPVVSASEFVGMFTAYIHILDGVKWKYLINPNALVWLMDSPMGEPYDPEGEYLYNLDLDPYETTNVAPTCKNCTNVDDDGYELQLDKILTFMRAQVLKMKKNGRTSPITQFPPEIDTPPSDLGCWLPLDSPLYATANCTEEGDEIPLPGTFKKGEVFVLPGASQGLGAADDYNQYVTVDMAL